MRLTAAWLLEAPAQAKVGNEEIRLPALSRHEQIIRLDVAMQYAVAVYVREPTHELQSEALYLTLDERPLAPLGACTRPME